MKKLLLLLSSLILFSGCGSGNGSSGSSTANISINKALPAPQFSITNENNPNLNTNTYLLSSPLLKGLDQALSDSSISNLSLPVGISQPRWYTQVGTTTITNANAIANDGMGHVYIVGSTNAPLYFNRKGLYDYFIVNGDYTALAQVGAPGGTTIATSVTTDNKGYIYVAGYTNVGISGQSQIGKTDYFIAKYAPSGAVPIWTRQVGAINGNSYATGIKFDSNTLGDIYISGYTDKVIAGGFQTGPIDSFIARYDINGNLIWLKQKGEVNTIAKATGVSIDSHDNIYIAGDLTESSRTDYYIAQYSNTGNLNWKKSVVSGGITQANAIAVDGYDTAGIYVVGSTTKGVSGESQVGNQDYFIAQYNINGILQWTKQIGALGGTTSATSASTDNFGNVYISGTTNKAISGQPLYGNIDSFIARYDRSGNLQWTVESGNHNANYEASGISNGKNGDVFVTGLTNFYVQVHKYENYFLVQYDSFGNMVNKALQLAEASAGAYGINVDNMGNIYITGSTNAGLSGQVQTGLSDSFIAKYDNDESLVWTRQLGANSPTTFGSTIAYGVGADNFGNVYITGSTNIELSTGASVFGGDYFIARYDSSGNLLWVEQVGGTSCWCYAYGKGISTDSSGNIYITGYTTGALSGGKQNGLYDYFIAKYDNNGNMLWTNQVGASGGQTMGYGISADSLGDIYVTGSTNVGISGQTKQCTSSGCSDYFIAKYDTNGNLIWSREDGAASGSGVSSDNFGNAYITGSTGINLSNHVPIGYEAYFIVKYDLNGNLIWTNQVGADKAVIYGISISTNNLGSTYVLSSLTNYGYHKAQINNGYLITKHDNLTGKLLWTTGAGIMQGHMYSPGISTDSFGNIYVTGSTNVGLFGQTQNGGTDYFIAKYIN